MSFELCHAIFGVVPSMYFCELCTECIKLVKRVLAVAVLLDRFCYILLLCKPAATSQSMHNLEMFTKDDLLNMSCSIHPCPWVYL